MNVEELNLLVLPINVILNIIKFLDIPILEKIIKIFEKKKELSLYNFLQHESKKILNKKIYNIRIFRKNCILNKLIKNTEQQINRLINRNIPFIFVRNNIEDIGYSVRKVDLINLYKNKLEIIKINYNDLNIEDVILLFKNIDHAERYCVFTKPEATDAENIGYENMFNSHINNCVCRTIHEWCKGKYCGGCKKCDLFFPTPCCLNIKQWDFRLPISLLPQVVLESQREHSL